MSESNTTSKNGQGVYRTLITDHLLRTHRAELVDILKSEVVTPSLLIDWFQLMTASDIIFTKLITDSDRWFPKLDAILMSAVKQVFEELGEDEKGVYSIPKRVSLRLKSLPDAPEFQKTSVPKCENVGQMVAFTGTIIKSSEARMLTSQKLVECTKCRHQFHVKADYEQYYEFSPPPLCPSPEGCSNQQFTDKEQFCKEFCIDYQEMKVQEQVSNLCLGTIPRSVWVTLEDDLVDVCKPGDDVLVIGCVKRRWRKMGKGKNDRTDIDLAIKANSIKVKNMKQVNTHVSKELEAEFRALWINNADLLGRDKIISMFCPQVYGLYLVKLALAVSLAGGVARTDSGGTRIRGEPHLLLVGDPGTGKSQLLKYGCKISHRSVMTTGIGSTSAGLTVSASREGGNWHLEAGALVLADGGVCFIDEFSSIKQADRTCIHEAMEQQSLSIAKAGMVCRLQTRCTILAATNPKGKYDLEKSISDNTGIASPLLSRFDLVFLLLDRNDESWDRLVSSFVLQGQNPLVEPQPEAQADGGSIWAFEKIQAYFQFIKQLSPLLTSDANIVLTNYYKMKRNGDSVDKARTTVRLLQSCIRLAQGHAKLMCRDEVGVQDAVCAVLLLESSTSSPSRLVRVDSALHAAFPTSPLSNYKAEAKMVLEGLNLPHLWRREKARIEAIEAERLNRESSSQLTAVGPAPPQPAVEAGDNNQLNEVMRLVQLNRLPSYQQPDSKKSNKRKRTAPKVLDPDADAENEDPSSSVEPNDQVSAAKFSRKTETPSPPPRKSEPTQPRKSEPLPPPEGSDDDRRHYNSLTRIASSNRDADTTDSSASSQVSEAQPTSLLQGNESCVNASVERPSKISPKRVGRAKGLSKATLKKLQSFSNTSSKEVDESTVTIKEDGGKDSAAANKADSSLSGPSLASDKLASLMTKINKSSGNKTIAPLKSFEIEDDLDFDLDI